jgi:hypothetical protein
MSRGLAERLLAIPVRAFYQVIGAVNNLALQGEPEGGMQDETAVVFFDVAQYYSIPFFAEGLTG